MIGLDMRLAYACCNSNDYSTTESCSLMKFHELQCLKVEAKEKDIKYYVHYSGWNKG